jgi:hypothetical protein
LFFGAAWNFFSPKFPQAAKLFAYSRILNLFYYHSTLAASIDNIILNYLQKMLKNLKNTFFKEQNFVKENREAIKK